MTAARWRLALSAAALVGLTACGTTVPQTTSLGGGGVPAAAPAGSPLTAGPGDLGSPTTAPDSGAPGAAADRGTTDSGSTAGVAGSAPVGSAAAGHAGPVGATPTPSPGRTAGKAVSPTKKGASGKPVPGSSPGAGKPVAPAGGASGYGFTATTINIGIIYQTNNAEENAALGAANESSGDVKAEADAVVADVNAHGGMAGRTVVPVYYAYDATSQASHDSQDAAACAQLTEDNHVFAAMGVGSLTDDYPACLSKAGVVQIDESILYADNGYYAEFPNYFNVSALSQDRMMADDIATLKAQNYFTPWNATTGTAAATGAVKVGILSVDLPEWDRPLDSVLLPALKAAGYPPNSADVFRIHNPNAASEDAQTVSQIESAELQLREDGVTHVIFLDSGGSLLLLFGAQANQQKYFPRFGLNTGSAAEAVLGAGEITAQQLNGMAGLGWAPSIDLTLSDSTPYETAAAKACFALISAKTGQQFSNVDEEAFAETYCDSLSLLRQAGNAVATNLSEASITSAIEKISSFDAAAGSGIGFSPTRRDGPTIGYDLTFNSACGCVRYAPGQHTIP